MRERSYRVRLSYFLFSITIFLIACYLPAKSIWEVLTTGSIDLSAVGGGRGVSRWKLYIIGWLSLLLTGPFLLQVIQYYLLSIDVRISADAISVGKKEIKFSDVTDISRSGWLRSLKIRSSIGMEIKIYPVFGKKKFQEIEDVVRQPKRYF